MELIEAYLQTNEETYYKEKNYIPPGWHKGTIYSDGYCVEFTFTDLEMYRQHNREEYFGRMIASNNITTHVSMKILLTSDRLHNMLKSEQPLEINTKLFKGVAYSLKIDMNTGLPPSQFISDDIDLDVTFIMKDFETIAVEPTAML
jgi:hypothetical protein